MRRRASPTLALDGQPPVTLGLRRFVLRSVGPPAARFHPLDLDLVTSDGTVARRALCVLTNTGGKSTLLKLLSAVVNPGTAGLIGKGEVADMVLCTDTSHVVLDWQQADGVRYVTGWMAEWTGFDKPASGARGLRQCWYFFRSNGVGVDDLPFEHEGRRVRWDEYRRQLRALFAAHPGTAGYIADTQVDWGRVLVERTRIDAELFRYQAAMNAAESGAAALVTKLKTPEAFVGFFVSAFDDAADTATLFREVAAYTTQAARRAGMEAHAALCAELVQALQGFEHEDANYAAAVDMERADVERRRELAGAVRARATVEARRARAAEDVLVVETERLAAITRAIDGDEDRRKQYLFLEAEMRRTAALEAEAEAIAAERGAELQRNAWAAVPSVMAHDAATAAHEQAKLAFDAAEHELAPLRARVEEAASRLVAALGAQASAASATAAAAGQQVAGARSDAARAAARREAALKAGAGLRHELEAGDERSTRAAQAVTEARRRGDVADGETAALAAARWSSVQGQAVEDRRRAADDRTRANHRHREAMRGCGAADIALRDARAAISDANQMLARAASSASRVLANSDVGAVVGDAPVDVAPHRCFPAALATVAAAVIDRQAEGVERSAQDTWADLRAVEAELGRLAGSDLLDAGPDVVSAVSALRDARIGALAGWSWIAGTVAAEDRSAFIVARPDIANGVVVSDPNRLDDARTTLEKAGLFPRLAVVVTTSETATATADGLVDMDQDAERFVVEPHPGLYDKDKAEEEIAHLEGRQAMFASRHGEQVARAHELREAAGLARRHAAEWPDSTLEEVEERLTEAERRVIEAVERVELADTSLKAAAKAEEDAATAEQDASLEEREAGAARLRMAPTVEAEAAAAAHAAVRPGLVERIARHDREATVAAEVIEEANTAVAVAEGVQRESERNARESKERAAQIGAPPAAIVPTDAVHILEAEHTEANRRFADEAAGRDHHEALERARFAVARTAESLTGIAADVLSLASTHSMSVMAATPDSVRAQISASVEAWKASIDRRSQRRRDVERWEAEATDHRPPTDRTTHATLAAGEVPIDADDAARRASDLSGALVAARAMRDSQQASRDAVARERDVATTATIAFTRLVSDQDDPVTGADAYVGDVDAALSGLNRRREAVTEARALVAEAKLGRQRASSAVNNQANNRRWADITDSLKELCAAAAAEALTQHGERYLNELRTREASLRADLSELDTHRSAVIDSLGQTCDRLRRNLHQVKSASTIPAEVLNVGGHQAIVIDFKRLPAEAADVALSGVLDEWAASGADVQDSKARPVRLMQALSATVENRPLAGRWSVKLLKPRIDGDVTYCPPDRVTKEYSGGQELTLAVLLYCTLAAVRSDDRSGSSDRPPGLLLLDNPFGAASNERLIDMWQKLAEAADVQLLCFTALGEPSILNGFNGPGTFRQTLRNDRDQRNGHQHVRVVGADAAIQRIVTAHLAGPALEAGEESRVDGLGYQTKASFPVRAPTAKEPAEPTP